MPKECTSELKAMQLHSLISTEGSVTIESIMDPAKYSTLSRLLRVTARVLEAARRFRGQKGVTPSATAVERFQEAELLWVRRAQGTFSDLQNLTKQFNLFRDGSGVWRCGGRLANAEITYAVKFPILLLKSHPFTRLIVRRAHERVLQNGAKETLAEIRTKYWIPSGRSLTRKVIHECVTCRRFEGLPFKAPPPPPLPECRVKEGPAFSYTGVDFAGSLMTCVGPIVPATKAWIALFTCYVTRAVHLDTVPDQSTLAFIRCLKRFLARRGLPKRFISDNGKAFKAASKYLEKVFEDKAVQEHLKGLHVSWQFNVERAPWWGGAFERMVKSTKRCLIKLIGQAHFSLDELTTALAEIEAVLNSRPLSYVSEEDTEEPITPLHLVVGRRILSLPDDLDYACDLDDEEFTPDTKRVTSQVRHLNNVLNHFWQRWRTEYLALLREAHAHTLKKCQLGSACPISVGQIVIVNDEQLPRGQWKLGIVREVLKGRDGLIRAAAVKVSASDPHYSTLRRPIQALYPLEVQCESSDMLTPEPSFTTRVVEPVDTSEQVRPKRAAARRADEERRQWIAELDEGN